MTSKEFMHTSCQILFGNISTRIIVKSENGKQYGEEKRSDTISKYLKNSLRKSYSKTVQNIFLTRVRYHIYPEEFQKEVNEDEIIVFLNKSIYLFSSLFEMNFGFMHSDDFSKYKSDVYNLIDALSKLFAGEFEKDIKEITDVLLNVYCDDLNYKHKYTTSELDEFFEIYGKCYKQIKDIPDIPNCAESYTNYVHNSSVGFLNDFLEFIEVLFENNYYNNEVIRASILMRNSYIKISKVLYENIFQFNPNDKIEIEKDLKDWKSNLLNKIFSNGILIPIEKITSYFLYNEEDCFLKIYNIQNKLEVLEKKYYDESFEVKYDQYVKSPKKIDSNIFVFRNTNYIQLHNLIKKSLNFMDIKKKVYYYLHANID